MLTQWSSFHTSPCLEHPVLLYLGPLASPTLGPEEIRPVLHHLGFRELFLQGHWGAFIHPSVPRLLLSTESSPQSPVLI